MDSSKEKQIFAQNVLKFMEIQDIDRRKLADLLGVKYSTFCDWVQPKHPSYPKPHMVTDIADALCVNVVDLIQDGRDIPDNIKVGQLLEDNVMLNVIGKIPAGTPYEAIEDLYSNEHVLVNKRWFKGDRKLFALRIDGDSMEPTYHDGDVAIFVKSPTCQSGDDCCVRLNHEDVTFKKVTFKNDGVLISPINVNNSSGFSARFYNADELKSENSSVEILGYAIHCIPLVPEKLRN